MSCDPKTFADAIDVAVQETGNEKLKEQKAGLLRSATNEAVLRKVELDTLLHRLTELEVLVRQQADTIRQGSQKGLTSPNRGGKQVSFQGQG